MEGVDNRPSSRFGKCDDYDDDYHGMSRKEGGNKPDLLCKPLYKVLKDDTMTIMEPDSQSACHCHVHRLPDEIWVHIFRMIQSSKDLSSCSKTCKLWKRILMDWSPYEIRFDEIFPLVSPFLNLPQILKCRHINSVWKNSVDESSSKRPEVLPLGSLQQLNGQFGNYHQWFMNAHPLKRAKPLDFNKVECNPHWNVFSETSKLQKFYDKLSDLPVPSVNPFISRSIFLYIFTNPEDNPTFMLNKTSALEFLTQFGREIWSITLGGLWWDKVANREESLVLALHDCLMELPNLKYLDFAFTMEQNPSNFDESTLYQKLCESPLPHLKNLETLRFAPSVILLPVQLALLQIHASHLKRLDLFEDEHKHGPWACSPSSSKLIFPVLKEINMSMDVVATALNSLPIFKTAPLETLVIEVKTEVDEDKMKILMELITSLFGETLRVLYLEMNHQVYSKATPFSLPVEVQMPRNLESLTLSGCSNLSLNSILCLATTLKYLSLEAQDCNLPLFRHPDEILDLRELVTLYVPTTFDVYISNVWDLLPKLKKLLFNVLWTKRRVFTRETRDFYKNEYAFILK